MLPSVFFLTSLGVEAPRTGGISLSDDVQVQGEYKATSALNTLHLTQVLLGETTDVNRATAHGPNAPLAP